MSDFSWKETFKHELLSSAFNLDKLTENQAYLIMMPTEAPENFYCDGEIKPPIAVAIWIRKMKESGLSKDDINRAIKMNFDI